MVPTLLGRSLLRLFASAGGATLRGKHTQVWTPAVLHVWRHTTQEKTRNPSAIHAGKGVLQFRRQITEKPDREGFECRVRGGQNVLAVHSAPIEALNECTWLTMNRMDLVSEVGRTESAVPLLPHPPSGYFRQ
eukprot:scaffold944_cov333-Pavlova_lutheri.AAC.16